MTPRSTSRRKKTRYLSLRRRLAAAASAAPMVVTLPSPTSTPDHTQQLELFPLHPGTTTALTDDDPHDEQLSRFFPGDDAVTLHSLLGPHSPSSPATASDSHLSPSSSSANYSACSSSYGGGAAAGLVRAALRGRERWWAEEEEEGEAASGGATVLLSGATRRLSLKLDYDGILSAWSGDRPLFVDGDGLQVVPDLHHTAAALHYTPVFVDVGGCGGGGLWSVPDGGGATAEEGEDCGGGRRRKEEEGEEEGEEKTEGGKEAREARVMRYKEKRRHRLFAKRIRYEVRKLNAEKRPRVKVNAKLEEDDSV